MRWRVWLPFVVFAGIAVALFSLFLALFEPRVISRFTGLQGEAGQNPFLPLEYLLNRQGYQADSVAVLDIDNLPDTDTILVYTIQRTVYNPELDARLLKWVQEGGFLILEATQSNDIEGASAVDTLLTPLGISNHAGYPEGMISLQMETDETPYLVAFGYQFRLDYQLPDHSNYEYYEDSSGILFAVTNHGKGIITAFCDAHFLEFDLIQDHDHAAFFLRLLQLYAPNRTQVTFVYREGFPSFWALLFERGKPVWIAFGLLMMVLLWRGMMRFGPLLPDATPARRSLLDALEAEGRFHWSHGQFKLLVEAAQNHLMWEVECFRPHWKGLPPQERHALLAELGQLPGSAVERAMDPEQRLSNFQKNMAVLSRLSRALRGRRAGLALPTSGRSTPLQKE